VRDAIGHEVLIDTAPHRIVSLDPGMTAAMYALGAGKLLVGRSGAETYPKQAMNLPVMLKDGKPNVAAIERLRPDLVLVRASRAAATSRPAPTPRSGSRAGSWPRWRPRSTSRRATGEPRSPT